MCRIAGILNKSLPINEISLRVEAMCELMKNGGPDDGGLFVSKEDHLVLGNRRLSLVDLSNEGHMPMEYRQRYHITFNGEIYNFKSLRNELEQLGHVFRSNTDTEVVLAAFAQWDWQSFRKLKGMFAFALWDDVEKLLYLVRDPSGMKPLYFSSENQTLNFASEIRAFAPLKEIKETNPNWQVFFMAYGHLPEPVTTLKKVKPLNKGCFLKYDNQKSTISIQSFSHYSYSNSIRSVDNSLNLVKESITRSTERHLIADAPLGVFLSGGVDSGILAITASQFKQENLNTISIYFREKEFSEKYYQDIILENLKCKSYQFLLEENFFNQMLPSIIDSMDMPSCDGINTWFICKYAKEIGLKAVLSGLGGDELFGGYPSFKRIQRASYLQQVPNPILSSGKRAKTKLLKRADYLRLEGIRGIYLFLRGHFSIYDIATQLGAYENDIQNILEEKPILTDVNHLELKDQAAWMEMNLYMQNQLLRDSDVMGMHHGVEIRLPFLDDDLIRLVFSVDPKIKYQGPSSKEFLVNAFENVIPRKIWDRPKMGFSFPFSDWLKKSDFVKEIMTNSSNKTQKENYLNFIKGDLHWSHLMSLLLIRKREMSV